MARVVVDDRHSFIPLIKSLLKDDDASRFMRQPLSLHFLPEIQMTVRNNINKFFDEFAKVKDNQKFVHFVEVTKDISEWIPLFLDDSPKAKTYRIKFNVIFEMLHIQSDEAVENFPMDEVFLYECCHKGLITDIMRDNLIANLTNKGPAAAKYDFLWSIPLKSEHSYGLLLQILYKYNTAYIENFCDDLYKSISVDMSEKEANEYILVYAQSIIEKNMNVSCIIEEPAESNHMEYDGHPNASEDMSQVLDDMDVCVLTSNLDKSRSVSPKNSLVTCGEEVIENVKYSIGLSDQSNNVETKTEEYMKSENGKNECIQSDGFAGALLKVEDIDETTSDAEEDDELGNDDDVSNIFGELKNKDIDDILDFTVPKSRDGEVKKLEVRSYQEELAKQGIEGGNVLICSPTGSGKTIVAVKIVEEHLRKSKGAKVVFLVHRIALVEQQYAVFSKYLKCKVTRLSGSLKTASTPLIGHIPSFDVFIMTSDILRNALEQDNETKLESLGIFSMILFDECHNCDKKHPYNRIMNHYFQKKREDKKVPQIIGLTASTGTNKANTMDKAMKRLFGLCANLDTKIVSTVKEYVEELLINQSKPEQDILQAQPRKEDKFEVELQKQMEYCEHVLHEMNKRDFFPKDPETQLIFSIPEDRMHQKYAGFVGKLNHLLNVTKKENEGRESIYVINEYLNAFVRALMVNHLFRAQDSIKLIRDMLHLDLNTSPTCKIEGILRKKLSRLDKGDRMQTCNPCLQTLQDQITAQLNNGNTSRIIVFVRERTYTQILKDVFTSLNDPKIKCDTIVGNTISAEKGGLTQNEMEEVLGRFRSGQCNVLFSTTVAEEGLDVQECNLVIRYGHVTNETAMVQSRGRARAKDSKYLVIVPHKLQWQVNKENINKYRETMMYRAIEKFQAMDVKAREHEIDECQFERQLMETMEATKKISLGNNHNADLVRTLYCKKCSTEICKSSDIRLVVNAHHIVINSDVFQRMVVNEAKTNQVNCKKCKNQLGNRQSYRSRIFPNLTISAFSILCDGDLMTKSFKKWRDVDFSVPAVTNKELLDFQVQHSLSF